MIQIQKVTPDEAAQLLAFSKKTFHHFFAPINNPVSIEAYSAKAFTLQKIKSELANPDSEFYFAMSDDDIAGYIKLNFGEAQTEFKDNNTAEIERIYVAEEHHGKHIGRQLLNFAAAKAESRHLHSIWLGVWEYNTKAIGFYEHHGFKIFSSHEFWLGDERQTDLLMRKTLRLG
ncbi:MAG: GNAT family N-acetyltransferase [Sphingobacteriales bacterium]